MEGDRASIIVLDDKKYLNWITDDVFLRKEAEEIVRKANGKSLGISGEDGKLILGLEHHESNNLISAILLSTQFILMKSKNFYIRMHSMRLRMP